jgi:hypothetical protein
LGLLAARQHSMSRQPILQVIFRNSYFRKFLFLEKNQDIGKQLVP